MALFKILKGNVASLPDTCHEGWMYITQDTGDIYVDISDTSRIQLNADKATSIRGKNNGTEVLYSYDDLLALATNIDNLSSQLADQNSIITNLDISIGEIKTNYLPLSGGKLTGTLELEDEEDVEYTNFQAAPRGYVDLAVNNAVADLTSSINDLSSSLNSTINGVSVSLEEHKTANDTSFSSIDKQISTINTNISTIEDNIDSVEKDIASIETVISQNQEETNAKLNALDLRKIQLVGSAQGGPTGESISTPGTIVISTVLNSTGVEAEEYGANSKTELSDGDAITIPKFTVQSDGRIIAAEDQTLTLPNTTSIENDLIALTSQVSNIELTSKDNNPVAVSGKIAGSGTIEVTTSIANTGVEHGTYGNVIATTATEEEGEEAGPTNLTPGTAFIIPTFTVNTDGRITEAENVVYKIDTSEIDSRHNTLNTQFSALEIANSNDSTVTLSGTLAWDTNRSKPTLTARAILNDTVSATSVGPSSELTITGAEESNASITIPNFTVQKDGRINKAGSATLTFNYSALNESIRSRDLLIQQQGDELEALQTRLGTLLKQGSSGGTYGDTISIEDIISDLVLDADTDEIVNKMQEVSAWIAENAGTAGLLATHGNKLNALENLYISLSGDASGNTVRFSGAAVTGTAAEKAVGKLDLAATLNSLHNNELSAGSNSHSPTEPVEYGAVINIPSITVNKKGLVTSLNNQAIVLPLSDNTDTTVIDVDHHYTPVTDSDESLSVNANSSTKATWGSTQLVTGITLQRDAAGHVTDLSVNSIRMPTNPNTDTHHQAYLRAASSATGTANAANSSSAYLNLIENGSVRSSNQMVGTGSVTVSSDTNGKITIKGVDTTYNAATASTLGLVKVRNVRDSAITTNSTTSTSSRYYPIESDSNNQLFVNVPWTNTTYTADKGLTLSSTTFKANLNSEASLGTIGTTSKLYAVGVDANGKLCVNVPWTDTNTNTKNTAGSTNTSDKIYLIGATSQAANPQTYSHDTAYVDTDGCLYSNNKKVSVDGHAHSYLPLSGGTLTSTNNNAPLKLKTSYSSTDLYLPFVNKDDTVLGEFAFFDVGEPGVVCDGVGYRIFHGGYYPVASTVKEGMVKVSSVNASAVTVNSVSTTAGRYYPVELNSDNKLIVNVPWTDTNTNTTYTASTGLTLSGTAFKAKLNSESSLGTIGTTSKLYAVGVDANGKLCVNVPWTDTNTNTTYGVATSSSLGLVKIGYTTSGKNYAVQLDSNNKMYVNVPWTDTNTTYSSLKNPYSLTIQGNGTSSLTYDGSAAKTLNIKGSGATSVSCDSSGNITISSTDTNTNTTYSAGTGLTLSGTTFQLASGVCTAGTYGPSANVSGSNGATINVPQITVDAYGRVTSVTNRVYTSVNSNTTNTTGTTNSTSILYLAGATSQASAPQTYSNSAIKANCNASGSNEAGSLTATKIYGAVWNDYAEYRESNITEPGRVICENGDDTLGLATVRLQPGASVISDTFGFAIGHTEKAQTPIAVSGRVLVYTYEDRDSYKPGDAVCAAPGGTVSKMTREEIMTYPERIIGTVSAIPSYETWGEANVTVNGRIWIKIK